MSGFADHFSTQAETYARHRPRYPAALYGWLSSLAPAHERAWDCACGQGQAALALAEHFAHVDATDASAEQLAHAFAHPKVHYRQATSEASGLDERSVDLVAVAAAAHWFDLDRFYAEVRRVARPGAAVALWSYGARIDAPGLDEELHRFADEDVGEHWPPEFAHVRTAYQDLPFPFEAIEPPPFAVEVEWTAEQLLGWVRSWSGTERARRALGRDPVERLEPWLAEAWGDEERRLIRLPLFFKVGRVAG